MFQLYRDYSGKILCNNTNFYYHRPTAKSDPFCRCDDEFSKKLYSNFHISLSSIVFEKSKLISVNWMRNRIGYFVVVTTTTKKVEEKFDILFRAWNWSPTHFMKILISSVTSETQKAFSEILKLILLILIEYFIGKWIRKWKTYIGTILK